MTETRVPSRGRRHPMTVVTTAREMHDAGWGDAEIQRYFAARGIDVSLTAIGRWCNPAQAARQLANQKRWNAILASRRSVSIGPKHARPEFKFARLCALRAAGLSVTAAAAVMRLDFGDDLTPGQVRHAEMVGRYPKKVA